MLKEERLNSIETLVDQKGIVRVQDIVSLLNVSDMTVRRDLTELEKDGRLKRIHGGAQSVKMYKKEELSHKEKKIINVDEKTKIASLALSIIKEGETIFLGPGTTIEILADMIKNIPLRVVTNSLPVFTKIENNKDNIKVYLLGGEMRKKTESFCGEMTDKILENIRFSKTFFSCNAVKGNNVMTATIEEGKTQSLALNNSAERYLLADASKINTEDFYSFYKLENLTAVITNDDEYKKYKYLDENTLVII